MTKIPIRQLHSPRQEQPSLEGFKIRKVEDLMGNDDLVHNLIN